MRRELVEILVGGIRVETVTEGARREAVVRITYRFPITPCQGTVSWSNLELCRVRRTDGRGGWQDDP